MVNLLTNYVDKKQKRLYRYRRVQNDVMTLTREFYLAAVVIRKYKTLLDKEVTPIQPLVVVPPEELAQLSYSAGLTRTKVAIEPLMKFKQALAVVGVRKITPYLASVMKEVTPVVISSVEIEILGIEFLPTIDEDTEEGDEEIEFI